MAFRAPTKESFSAMTVMKGGIGVRLKNQVGLKAQVLYQATEGVHSRPVAVCGCD
jgi:hypothetical protein